MQPSDIKMAPHRISGAFDSNVRTWLIEERRAQERGRYVPEVIAQERALAYWLAVRDTWIKAHNATA